MLEEPHKLPHSTVQSLEKWKLRAYKKIGKWSPVLFCEVTHSLSLCPRHIASAWKFLKPWGKSLHSYLWVTVKYPVGAAQLHQVHQRHGRTAKLPPPPHPGPLQCRGGPARTWPAEGTVAHPAIRRELCWAQPPAVGKPYWAQGQALYLWYGGWCEQESGLAVVTSSGQHVVREGF